ncbi:MAG: right-handed parallel beta-helix repeat-containing protein [Clostridia bacterium]|nr:right-handed parallel beta-helix repeat-containing protein [Clostridia bacterium]
MKNKKIIWIILGFVATALSCYSLYCFYYEYLHWDNMPVLGLYAALGYLGVGLLAGAGQVLREAPYKKGKQAGLSILCILVYAALQWGITFYINVIVGKEQMAQTAIDTATGVQLVFLLVLFAVFVAKTGKKYVQIPLTVGGSVAAAVLLYSMLLPTVITFIYKDYKAAAPIVNPIAKEELQLREGDFYVSPKGSDENDGSLSAPFATIQKAQQAVRELDKTGKDGITVCLMAGDYRVSSVVFTAEDSGTAECPVTYCAYGDGEVVLNGGQTLQPSDFVPASQYAEIFSRLSDIAKEKVFVLDLTKEPYSLTADDWGKLYAIGSYNTAAQYDGDYVGPLYCELFVNDIRQTVARYPNEGFLKTEEVVSTGLGRESDGALTAVENWDDIRNPEPDVYRVNKDLAARIASWKELDKVWMMGYWKYDWADGSTLIGNFEADTGILSPMFVSTYGTKVGAPYYFYNVLEELDTAGEWYLDREKGLLCLYAPENMQDATIDISLSLENILKVDASHLRFENLTVKGTRSDAVSVKGDDVFVDGCLVKNVAGYAILMDGYNNKAVNNEITRTGRGGIVISGGDFATLTPGNSIAENNLIHDWSEIYLTYQPAVTLNGVGNICSHNEMYNSPHEAITYSGNNHIIEYNLIHDVCLLSDDAGAIYSGRRWDWYGIVIRYNCIYNLGSDGHRPDGIYLDDALSGQTVYGNLLINIPKYALHLGGGRDLDVRNNIIINAGDRAVSYDSRAREGAIDNGWFTHSSSKDGDMWTNLFNSPWQTAVWQEAFPQYKSFSDDFENTDSPDFVPNPANSIVANNLIFDDAASIGNISEAADRFSTVSRENIYSLAKVNNFFADIENGDYSLLDSAELPEGFEALPLDKIGRY